VLNSTESQQITALNARAGGSCFGKHCTNLVMELLWSESSLGCAHHTVLHVPYMQFHGKSRSWRGRYVCNSMGISISSHCSFELSFRLSQLHVGHLHSQCLIGNRWIRLPKPTVSEGLQCSQDWRLSLWRFSTLDCFVSEISTIECKLFWRHTWRGKSCLKDIELLLESIVWNYGRTHVKRCDVHESWSGTKP